MNKEQGSLDSEGKVYYGDARKQRRYVKWDAACGKDGFGDVGKDRGFLEAALTYLLRIIIVYTCAKHHLTMAEALFTQLGLRVVRFFA